MSQAQSYMDNPMVRMTMEVYAAQIAEDPKDYTAYYSRGKDYYRYGDHDKALDDLSNAIMYFPRSESFDLSQAYTLRAFIYQERGDKNKALSDYNEAIILDPASRFALIGRGDLLFEMGDYNRSARDYEILIRRDARCQEAYLGLARIARRENNLGLCEDYLNKAEVANPSNPIFYIERAAFHADDSNMQQAANDYVKALVLGDSNNKALLQINKMSAEAYPEVIKALSLAINESQDKGLLLYLRAIIHKNNKHYTASINDWNTILADKLFYTHSIFYNRAYCYFHLSQFEYAHDDITTAIGMQGDQLPYYLLRSKLYRVTGDFEKAAGDLAVASTFNLSDVDVLLERGLLAAEQQEYDKATTYYNEAIITNADIPYAYMLRAVNYEKLGDEAAARSNYEMMLAVQDHTVNSLRGFALAKLGRTDEAEQWMETILRHIDGGNISADEYYYAACLYAMTGKKDRSLKYLEEALKMGYGDYYNIYFEYDSPISLEPLRGDAEFRSLIQGYNSVF